MDEHVAVIVHALVSLVVTKVVCSFTRFENIREIVKIKSFFCEQDRIHGARSLRIHFGEDPAIFTKDVIDAPHVFIGVFIEFIIEGVAAVIRAEFLVAPTA